MTYGKKQIFDVATNAYIEEELTIEEKAAFDKAVKDHELEMVELQKTQYLLERKADKDWPTLEEMIWALWNDNKDPINARIKEIEAKYPEPTI
jgi:hypothetical protein